jgi:phosphoribosylanthranilate isomerase
MRVKICGITNKEDALAACNAGADALGFVFAEAGKKRNRYISPEDALAIIECIPPFVDTVAVVVNDPLPRLQEYLQFMDYVQLHGDEGPEYGKVLGHRCIKVFRAGSEFSVQELREYKARAFLIDTFAPGDPGGTGETGNWNLAQEAVATGKPIILAGGLNAENITEAICTVRPMAVDTSSGVESTPGKKDHEQLRRFIHLAKTSLA